MNYGLIQEKQKPFDWLVGGFTPLGAGDINPSGDWNKYLPVIEYQNNGGWDRWACVTYAILNCLEILYKYKTSTEINWSDRFSAKVGGTKIGVGAYVSTVFDAMRNTGLVLERDYPDTNIQSDYYQDIPQEVMDKVIKYDIYREWILPNDKDVVYENLRQAPMPVTVCAAGGTGILNPTGKHNHLVSLINAEYGQYWEIYDHYTQSLKKYAWEYRFGSILKPTFNIKIETMKVINNQLYLLVQGKEQVLAMGLDGKLMIFDDWSKAIINSASREKKYVIPTPVTLDSWNSVEHINSKGELI
jgi:hypothetical protein